MWVCIKRGYLPYVLVSEAQDRLDCGLIGSILMSFCVQLKTPRAPGVKRVKHNFRNTMRQVALALVAECVNDLTLILPMRAVFLFCDFQCCIACHCALADDLVL